MKKELLSKKKEPSEDSKGVLHNSKATIGTRPKLLIPLSFFFWRPVVGGEGGILILEG